MRILGQDFFTSFQRQFCSLLSRVVLAESSINSDQHPTRSKIAFLEPERLFPVGRGFLYSLLSESQKSGRPINLIRLRIEPKGDIDFVIGLFEAIFFGQNSRLYGMGFGQLGIECEGSF